MYGTLREDRITKKIERGNKLKLNDKSILKGVCGRYVYKDGWQIQATVWDRIIGNIYLLAPYGFPKLCQSLLSPVNFQVTCQSTEKQAEGLLLLARKAKPL